jgi:thiopeptide-type bacteriocin biosynthesis protein
VHQTDTPAGPSWLQVNVEFDHWNSAEQAAVAHLGPLCRDAAETGLISAWFFIRKFPCWRLRLQPACDPAIQGARDFVRKRLDTLHEAGAISQWVETLYEPESHAFGGSAAMDIAHTLFHQDSQHILNYLAGDRATTTADGRDQRREITMLLWGILMRAAGQDWYEQGDIWARVREHRTLRPDIPTHRLDKAESDLRRLMTVDTTPLLQDTGSLAFLSAWATAFETAGTELSDLARNGTLHRGLRAVLAHHVIFTWNRIGLSHATQSVLANVATTVVLGP